MGVKNAWIPNREITHNHSSGRLGQWAKILEEWLEPTLVEVALELWDG